MQDSGDLDGQLVLIPNRTSPTQQVTLAALSRAIVAAKSGFEAAGIELPADIVVLRAGSSLGAAIRGEAEVTPGGAVVSRNGS